MRRLLVEMPGFGINKTVLTVIGCTVKIDLGEHSIPSR
jgi:hypothetical protein